jgi:hypothetical protein
MTVQEAVSKVEAASVCPLLKRAVETVGPERRDLPSSARRPLPSDREVAPPRTGVLHSVGTA